MTPSSSSKDLQSKQVAIHSVKDYGSLDDSGYRSILISDEGSSEVLIYDVHDDTSLPLLKTNPTEDLPPAPDGGWGWVVVAASFFCLCVLDGISYTFGMFLAPLMADMECGRGAVSAAGSLQVGVYSLTSLLSAKLVTRYGARPVCVSGSLIAATGLVLASFSWNMVSLLASYSFITGVGFGLIYIPSVVAVAQQFTSKQGLAIGMCVCGSGMGTFLLAPLEDFLLAEIGWRKTFVCMAGLCCLCTLCGAAMTPVQQLSMKEERSTNTPDRSGLKNCISMMVSEELFSSPAFSNFLLISIADCIASMAIYIPFTFLPDEANNSGLTLEEATSLISAMGICSAIGRVCSGVLCDRAWCHPVLLTATMVLAASVPPLLFPWSSTYLLYLSLSCMFGLLTGVWIGATSPLLVRLLGLSLLPQAFGLMTAIRTAALAGPPLAGLAVDLLSDRGVALYISGGGMVLASGLYAVVWISLIRRTIVKHRLLKKTINYVVLNWNKYVTF